MNIRNRKDIFNVDDLPQTTLVKVAKVICFITFTNSFKCIRHLTEEREVNRRSSIPKVVKRKMQTNDRNVI